MCPTARNFFARQGDLTRQYFVYCKENQRSMAEKDPPFGYIDIFQTRPRGGPCGRPLEYGLRSKRAPSSVTASLCPFVPSGHFPLIGGVVLPPWRGKAWLGRHMRPLLQRCQNLAPSSASHSLGTFPLGGRFEIGNVGSAYSSAVRKPHQQQILSTQAPSGAGRKRRQALLILRAGTMAVQTRRASPVKRGPGKAVLWT